MAKLEELRIDVPHDMAAGLRAAVAAGEFADMSEAVQVAVEAWQAQRALEGWDVEELRKLVQEGINSGQGIPADEVFDRLIAKYRAI